MIERAAQKSARQVEVRFVGSALQRSRLATGRYRLMTISTGWVAWRSAPE